MLFNLKPPRLQEHRWVSGGRALPPSAIHLLGTLCSAQLLGSGGAGRKTRAAHPAQPHRGSWQHRGTPVARLGRRRPASLLRCHGAGCHGEPGLFCARAWQGGGKNIATSGWFRTSAVEREAAALAPPWEPPNPIPSSPASAAPGPAAAPPSDSYLQ